MPILPLVVLAIFVGALTRATFGFGEAVVSMPLLALMPLSLHTAASLVGLAGLTVAFFSTLSRSAEVDRRALIRLSIGTVVGIPLGIALLIYVPVVVARTTLGALLVLYGMYGLRRRTQSREIDQRWAYPAGLLAGALGSAYNFNGVPVVVYGTARGWRPSVFRGTMQAHFVLSGVLVVGGQALGGIWTSQLPWMYAAALPAIMLATWGGHRLHRRIPAERFGRYVYMLVCTLGVVLLTKAIGLQ